METEWVEIKGGRRKEESLYSISISLEYILKNFRQKQHPEAPD